MMMLFMSRRFCALQPKNITDRITDPDRSSGWEIQSDEEKTRYYDSRKADLKLQIGIDKCKSIGF